MSDRWQRVPCSTNSCPEWRQVGDVIIILRSSAILDRSVWFTLAEWKALGEAFKRGDLDQAKP
jgi:hypothetical protein